MHKTKSARKSTRASKSLHATIIILNVPKELQPVLAACCAQWEQVPEEYTLDALLAALRCDVEIFCATSKDTLQKIINGGKA